MTRRNSPAADHPWRQYRARKPRVVYVVQFPDGARMGSTADGVIRDGRPCPSCDEPFETALPSEDADVLCAWCGRVVARVYPRARLVRGVVVPA